jgi:myosin heavy subunit
MTTNKKKGKQMVRLTLRDDVGRTTGGGGGLQFDDYSNNNKPLKKKKNSNTNHELDYFADVEAFETTLLVELSTLSNADHPDVKLRNLTNLDESSDYGGGGNNGSGGSGSAANPSKAPSDLRSPRGMRNRMSYSLGEKENGGGNDGNDDDDHRSSGIVVGGVHDLIGLTHLHEPAILHALRLRYDAGIIYTSTGPILIAINPFQKMTELYSTEVMECYRKQGEGYVSSGNGGGLSGTATPFKQGVTPYKQNGRGRNNNNTNGTGNDAVLKLPPHAYKTADDAYRAMRRGLEDVMLKRGGTGRVGGGAVAPADQSILVSGESGAGKTVTTKIVLNYLAMLSGQVNASEKLARQQRSNSPKKSKIGSHQHQQPQPQQEGVCIEQQVLQSNPILEAFGNAKTLRNDNSSRFGKYIDIQFTSTGQLSGAKIETYLLEKVRLIHPSAGERNYHIFYQFLEAATARERSKFLLDGLDVGDFKLLNGSGTRERSDGVVDGEMHAEMLDAMVS